MTGQFSNQQSLWNAYPGPEVLPMKCLPVFAIAILALGTACSTKQQDADPAGPQRSPIVAPPPPVGSWILDAPNQPVK
jgi:hypothetical protein